MLVPDSKFQKHPGDSWIQANLPRGSLDHKRKGCLGAGNPAGVATWDIKDRITRSHPSFHPQISWLLLFLVDPDYAEQSLRRARNRVWEQTGKWPAPLLFIIRFHFIFQCLGPWGGISPHNPIVLLTLPHQKKNAFLKHRENHLAGLHKFIFYGKALRHQNQRWRKEYSSQNKLYCSLEMFCT